MNMNEQNNLNETIESAQQPVYEQQPVQPPVYEQPVYQQQYQQPAPVQSYSQPAVPQNIANDGPEDDLPF